MICNINLPWTTLSLSICWDSSVVEILKRFQDVLCFFPPFLRIRERNGAVVVKIRRHVPIISNAALWRKCFIYFVGFWVVYPTNMPEVVQYMNSNRRSVTMTKIPVSPVSRRLGTRFNMHIEYSVSERPRLIRTTQRSLTAKTPTLRTSSDRFLKEVDDGPWNAWRAGTDVIVLDTRLGSQWPRLIRVFWLFSASASLAVSSERAGPALIWRGFLTINTVL